MTTELPTPVRDSASGAPLADPVTVEVVRYGLVAAAEQMATSIERSARSQVIREMLDYSTALFDLQGGIVAQSTRIPVHLNSMTRALQTMLRDHFPLDSWGEGDIYCTNDPYAGGQHLPDIMTFSLVVVDGEPVAICGSLGHHLDVGGRGPGSYGADATEIYQEGFRISPCLIAPGGALNPLFFQLLGPNIRVPAKTLADLQAQIASLDIGRAEVLRLVDRYGADLFTAAMTELVNNSEQRMRQIIASLPDGTFTADDWVDGDGLGDEPVPVKVAIHKDGTDLVVDFSGTAEQTRGPINAPLAATESSVYFAILSMLAPDLSSNHGCYKPIKVIAPPGSVVNPVEPAPVVGRNVLTHRITNVVHAALGDALPERAVAAYYGNSNVYILQAKEEDGTPNVLFEIEVGGWGGRPDRDGNECLSAGIHNLMNNPIELVEHEFPLRVMEYSLRADSGGAGRHRGGMGIRRVLELLEDSEFSSQFDRVKFPPPGRDGGEPGATARISVIHDGVETELPGKVLAYRLTAGDRVVIETQGGGGFGPPSQRSAQAVRHDLAEGRTTVGAARSNYPHVEVK
ncbi:MAG: hydantoinase B/oxoprolinase family protein [Solirubrobacteraceae bacterium]|nr:hydantoinase B/oxoprolinase family protein [Solirubrobacteraceae bacterium]